jgi:hypothetical protein
MNQLVLLVSPSEMQRNKHQMTLRKLFNDHLNGTIDEISEFLKSNNIPFSCDIGTNEFGKTTIAFAVEGENLFGLNTDNSVRYCTNRHECNNFKNSSCHNEDGIGSDCFS